MRSSTAVKIILIIFFITFFAFLFWFFYDPIEKSGNNNKNKVGIFSVLPFGDFFSSTNNTQQQHNTNIDNQNTNNSNTGSGSDSSGETKTPETQKYQMPLLRQISNVPTAGAFVQKLTKKEIFDLNTSREKQDFLDVDATYYEMRYISMKNNHVYNTYDFTPKVQRISNITIPKIFEAKFFDKDHYLIRYINNFDILKTYSVTLSDKSKVGQNFEDFQKEDKEKKTQKENQKDFQGIFLEDDIKQITILRGEEKIFYLKELKVHTLILIMVLTLL